MAIFGLILMAAGSLGTVFYAGVRWGCFLKEREMTVRRNLPILPVPRRRALTICLRAESPLFIDRPI